MKHYLVSYAHTGSPEATLAALTSNVESLINDGWQLQGELHLYQTPSTCSAYQALTKDDPIEEEPAPKPRPTRSKG